MNTSQIETQQRLRGTASVLRSLPRSPTPCTESLVTTTVTSAFYRNSQKRGLSDLMNNAPPPTPMHHNGITSHNGSSSSTSYLDCQSLQSSLKRVRLSSSPGELRLQRDLWHLVASAGWQKQKRRGVSANDDVYLWYSQDGKQQQHQQPAMELLQVESLRLRLSIQKNAVVWIQIPRMYPHRPPLVSCIVYPTQEGQSYHHAKRIHRILVLEEPPSKQIDNEGVTALHEEGYLSDHTDSQPQQVHYSADTAVYKEWSPVKQLSDVLQFVISVLNCDENNIHSSTFGNARSENLYGKDNNSMDTTTTINTTASIDSQDSLPPNPTTTTARQRSVNTALVVSSAKAKQLFSFAPNRFDLGYDRDSKLLLPMDCTIGRPSPVVATVSMDMTN